MRTAFLMTCVLASPLATQAPPTFDTPQAAWNRFRVDHGPKWEAEWNTATGTPVAMFGGALGTGRGEVHTRAEAISRAATVLADHADLLGRRASTFTPEIVERVGQTWVLVYGQRFGGLRVVAGRADVRLRQDGRVVLFGARCVPIDATFGLTARVEPLQAIATAYAHARIARPIVALEVVAMPELVVWADVEGAQPAVPRLAFAVRAASGDATRAGTAWVDARTGAVLGWREEVHACGATCTREVEPRALGRSLRAAAKRSRATVPGSDAATLFNVTGYVRAFVNQGATPGATLTEVPMPNLRMRVVGGGTHYTSGTTARFDIPTNPQDPTITVDFFLDGLSLAGLTNAAGAAMTQRVTFTNPSADNIVVFGSSGASEGERAQTTTYWHVNDLNGWMRTALRGNSRLDTLDDITATVNDASASCNAFYVANSMRFLAQSTTCNNSAYSSVIRHEWGHGLDDVFGGISTNDGLSEGNADIVAMFRSGLPEVGDGFFRDSRSPNRLRTGTNTRRYPVAGGTVHDMGEVWMAFAWDVRTRLMARWGTAPGRGRAEEYFFGSIVADAESLRAAVREVFLLDDDDADLCTGTPSYADLSAACELRGIPYPKIPCLPDASFIPFGPGCPGTGVEGVCLSANAGATSLDTTPVLPSGGRYAFPMLTRRPLMVSGLSVRTRSLGSGSTTATLALHAADGSDQPGAVVAGPVTFTIPATEGWPGAALSAPFSLVPGTTYFVVLDTTASSAPIAVPEAGSGFDAEGWHAPSSSTPWAGPFRAAFAWRAHCPPRPMAMPYLSARTFPRIGETLVLGVHGAKPSTLAVVWLGASSTSWGAIPLPYDLAPLGASGCPVVVSWDVGLFAASGADGTFEFALPVPGDIGLAGGLLFAQTSIVDTTANRLGLVTSNAARITLGD